MLKTLTVKSLFGLYTYELDFTNRDGSTIKFITGPNGYGKTTVLSLIYALYTCDFKAFMDIPFGELLFDFESESYISNGSHLFFRRMRDLTKQS